MDVNVSELAMQGIWDGFWLFVQAMPWWMWLLLPAALILGALPARRRRR